MTSYKFSKIAKVVIVFNQKEIIIDKRHTDDKESKNSEGIKEKIACLISCGIKGNDESGKASSVRVSCGIRVRFI